MDSAFFALFMACVVTYTMYKAKRGGSDE
jgi:hypothetical protein